MADFRFPGRWLNDRRVMSLTADSFKAFVTAGAWMVENRTDGVLTREDVEFIPRFKRSSVDDLVRAGVWLSTEDGWEMRDYAATQTSRAEFEVLERARKREREKKARQRASKASSPDRGDAVSRGTFPGDYTGEARPGKEGNGQRVESGGAAARPPAALDWPVAPIPVDPGYCTHGMTIGVRCRSCPAGIAGPCIA